MGINTDLNVDPYYDDFDESKQFNRVLFKPAKAVQARELTQLQTILQKQVERFGSNIYKEGTIISGVNLTQRDDINFVKLSDQSGFDDPSIFNEVVDSAAGTKTTFTVTGQTTGLVAEIIKGVNGFQTQDPDLKTFFINYKNTTVNPTNDADRKQFDEGETLDIKNSSGTIVQTVTVAQNVSNFVGKSFGISCEQGVIYQKGHFVFVADQFIVISKYSDVPGDVSVGFTVAENLVNSSSDSTLLDNAAGFNNAQAPGADRLQLVPTLVSFDSTSEPAEFFALIRYKSGKTVRLRASTEYSSIGDELARRTYDESGNYVTSGLRTGLEQDGSTTTATVSPGKAYVNGREVTNLTTTNVIISPTTSKQTKTDQYTGVSYGQYIDVATVNNSSVVHNFLLDGTRYNLCSNDNTVIATCSVANIEAGFGDGDVGRIYIYAIVTNSGQENKFPATIKTTDNATSTSILSGKIFDHNNSTRIFDTGTSSINSISATKAVQRKTLSATATSSGGYDEVTIAADQLATINNIFAISGNTIYKPAVTPVLNANNTVTVKFVDNQLPDGSTLYYDSLVSSVSHDSLQEQDVFVKATVDSSTGIANLGIPNVIKLISVTDNSSSTTDNLDVTGKFRLVNNQKDTFYDLSYIKLKTGETIDSSRALVTMKVKALIRTTPSAGGYLTANSYSTVTSKNLVQDFIGKDATEYTLLNTFDFRPYATPQVAYAQDSAGAGNATTLTAIAITNNLAVANNTLLPSTHEYFLKRIDTLVIDQYADIKLIKGTESENPSSPVIGNQFAIANVIVPSNVTRISGKERVEINNDIAVRNYTMEDIRGIEQRLDGMQELVSLSLLEQEAKDLLITDGNGNDRFKNGILVDSFRDFALAEMTDPEFNASIDKSATVLAPAVRQFPIDLKYFSGTTAKQFRNVATIELASSDVTVIEQKFATDFRNCASNFYNFNGDAFLSPPFDSGYDVTTNPAIDLEIDIAEPLLELIDSIQDFVPLTTKKTTKTEKEYLRYGGKSGQKYLGYQKREYYKKKFIRKTPKNLEVEVGNFITDINMKPYVRSKEVKVFISGLRPDTRHYFYFSGKSVDAHVYPGWIVKTSQLENPTGDSFTSATSDDPLDVMINAAKGSPVRSDSSGTIAAVFKIPEGTFFVGENILEVADVDQYSSIDSAKASYAKASYRAFNFNVNKSELNVNTRSIDFKTDIKLTNRLLKKIYHSDPIAQTFRLPASLANDSNIISIKSIDVYFKRKDTVRGVTLELREVINGFPSEGVLPFGRKHLRPGAVNVSDTASVSTSFEFADPVQLDSDKEYCFVIIPEANSPEYLVWTSKVGGKDKTPLTGQTVSSNVAVTNDWGDGVLFTSTNDSAWKSYQDEDIKFTVKRYEFKDSTLIADEAVVLAPNNPEFLTLTKNTGNFVNDEIAYVVKTTSYNGSISSNTSVNGVAVNNILTIGSATDFTTTDYVYIEAGTEKHISKILSKTGSGTSVITLETPLPPAITATSVTAFIVTAGRVSLYSKNRNSVLHLSESSARTSNYFADNAAVAPNDNTANKVTTGVSYVITEQLDSTTANELGASSNLVGTVFTATDTGPATTGTPATGKVRELSQKIIGYESGAFAFIASVNDESISYFQPQIYINNSNVTSTELTLMTGTNPDKTIPADSEVYTNTNARTIKSTSNRVPSGATEDFQIKIAMGNAGLTAASPSIDFDLSEVNAYKYAISNSENSSSKFISREVVLEDQLYADDLKVILTAYRPPGSIIDVYTRFVYPTNIETPSDWFELTNGSKDLFSNASEVRDYREFEYDLGEVSIALATQNSIVAGDEYRVLTLGNTTDTNWNTLGVEGTPTVGETFIAKTQATSAVTQSNIVESTNVITVNSHGFATGQRVIYRSGGGSPLLIASGISIVDGTPLFVKVESANSFKLASSKANADAGTTLDITNDGNDLQFFEFVNATGYGTGTVTQNRNYLSFQLKIVLRHMTESEMTAIGITGLTPDLNIFPHVLDYRAIALT